MTVRDLIGTNVLILQYGKITSCMECWGLVCCVVEYCQLRENHDLLAQVHGESAVGKDLMSNGGFLNFFVTSSEELPF